MKIAIVVPAYNEEKNIGEVLRTLSEKGYSLIVVNDGSTDSTSLKLRDASKNKKLQILTHKVNLGKGVAMKTGADFAFKNGFDAVIFIDSDGQHFADDLPRFVKALNDGYELVIGSRNLNMGIPLFRYLGNKLSSVIVNLLFQIYISDLLCGFRAMTKKTYKKIRWDSARYGVETEMVIRASKNDIVFCEVPVATFYFDQHKNLRINPGNKMSLRDALGIFISIIKWKFKI